ncbi:MAG: endonuclease/exonuclease/phosphatase family protein [Planctomycetota bacterium]
MRVTGWIVLAALIAAIPVAAGPPSPAPADGIGVLSFNIRYGTAADGENAWPRRRDQVIDVLRRIDADVVGLQEALRFQLDEITAALPGYREVGVGRDDGAARGEYSALLLRSERFDSVETGTFWLSDEPTAAGSTSWGNQIPRICTWAELTDRLSGRRLLVLNTHWDHRSQPSRERSGAAIRAFVDERRAGGPLPVLVLGDLNAGESNPATSALRGSGPAALVDTFRAVHPEAADVGTFHGFAGRRSGEKIDVVLASMEWTVLEAAIRRDRLDGRYPSDHFPVFARVRLETEPASR